MDLQATLVTALEVVKKAGEIPRRYFYEPFEETTKATAIDIVTNADRETEAFLREALMAEFPHMGIVGEEDSDYLPPSGAPEYWWYVDPIDGTTNFSHRLPYFSVLLALVTPDFRPVLGIVYDPMHDECFYGYQGGGAYLNGIRLHVSERTELVQSLVVTGFPYDRQTNPDNNLREFNRIAVQVQGSLRLGSAGLDLAYVASGRVDAFWEQRLNRWDVMAGILLVREAGGLVTDYQGAETNLLTPKLQVVASNGHIHQAMVENIQEARKGLTPLNLLMLSGDTALARGREGAFNQMLRRFAQYWERIDIITPRGGSERVVHSNVYVHPSPWHVAAQPLFILTQGRHLLAQREYALVVSHDFGVFYNGMGAWLLTAGSGIPCVSEIHHVEGYPFALTRRELIYRTLAKGYIKGAKRRVAAFRAVNRNEIPSLLREWGVAEEKILYLPSMYLDFEVFHPRPATEKIYDVLFVGRLAPNKGIFTLLEAVAQVKTTHPKNDLCLMGEGSLKTAIEAKIAALGLQKHVTMIPRLETAAEVALLYNQARMLVCASTSEGGPRVTLEAMACGTPVISTPVGIMKDLLEDGKNFLVFNWHAAPLAEKIRLLLDDPQIRQQVGENGEIAVQGFRAEDIIERYARGYQDLIQRVTTAHS